MEDQGRKMICLEVLDQAGQVRGMAEDEDRESQLPLMVQRETFS